MAPSNQITLCINDEGYNRKFFTLSGHTPLKGLLETYRALLCKSCSKPEILDFWYEANQLKDTDTPASLHMITGDMIDVRVTETVTRGACPIPPEQTLPNLHYIAEQPPPNRRNTKTPTPNTTPNPTYDPNSLFIPPFTAPGSAVRAAPPVPLPDASNRITLTVQDQAALSFQVRIKKTTAFRKVLEAYALQAQREPGACRLYLEGERLRLEQTPEEVKAEEGDLVEVFWEQVGGSFGLGMG